MNTEDFSRALGVSSAALAVVEKLRGLLKGSQAQAEITALQGHVLDLKRELLQLREENMALTQELGALHTKLRGDLKPEGVAFRDHLVYSAVQAAVGVMKDEAAAVAGKK